MGTQKRRLTKFLDEHPTCCFCGGQRASETEDHFPSRSIFKNRVWPKGYVFPSCLACNQATADGEAVIAMMSWFDPTSETDKQNLNGRSEKLIRAFTEKHPELVRRMFMSANEIRVSLRKLGLEKPDNIAYGEIPILKLPPEIHTYVENFGVKLIKALHYMHTGRIAPNDAGIKIFWHTNVQHMAGKFPTQILEIFKQLALPSRDSIPLHDQFSYRYGISDDGSIGGYIVFFRRSFSITGFINFDAAWFARHEELFKQKEQ